MPDDGAAPVAGPLQSTPTLPHASTAREPFSGAIDCDDAPRQAVQHVAVVPDALQSIGEWTFKYCCA